MPPNGPHYPCPGPEEFIIDLKSKSQNQTISTTDESVIVKVPFHIVIQTSRDDHLVIVSLILHNCSYYRFKS